jgi:DNA-binding CsgD family transcriptional regulator
MVGDRKSNKDIGAVLDISPRTVSTHLTNIFRKLDVASRGELADYVRRHGTGERAGAGAESLHDLVPTASS